MKISNVQRFLTSKASLSTTARQQINDSEQQLLKRVARLPVQSKEAQASQLEQMLTEISVADVDDTLRLRLMAVVMMAMESLIASLRKQYIYEVGNLSDSQCEAVIQVEALYQLALLVFTAIVQRESLALQYQQQQQAQAPSPSIWQRLLATSVTLPSTLAATIYQSLLMYQNLAYEKAICYRKALPDTWLAINKLYHLACQYDVAHTDLTPYVVTRQANSIHQMYCQICLYDLLNVLAMRRPSILLIQRLLPEWAKHIKATLEPQTQTRIFIDLKSDLPPQYLTAVSETNPYEDEHDCLFIELEPFTDYLQARQNALLARDKDLNEYRLITKILMAITHRYILRPLNKVSKYQPKKRGTLITGFNDIHYYVGGKRSVTDMVAEVGLSIDFLPRYDTVPRRDSIPSVFEIEMHDAHDSVSHFRSLRLLTAQDIVAQQGVVSANAQKYRDYQGYKTQQDRHTHQQGSQYSNQQNNQSLQDLIVPPLTEIFEPITIAEAEKSDAQLLSSLLATAPPRMRMMDLFFLDTHAAELEQNDKETAKSYRPPYAQPHQPLGDKQSWALGIIRWLTIDEEYVEAEGQILGYHPTACALRLDNRDPKDVRSQSFVPVLLLAADEALHTKSSLLVPSYHFKSNDKVVIRLNEKQKTLRLQNIILNTEEFTQFEVIVL